MIAKVLIDNNTRNEWKAEWGLAIHIDHDGHQILLDAGTTHLFAENAACMDVNLEQVEFGVLSHAHYDHSNGLDKFFEVNQSAKFYLRKGAEENCYSKKGGTELSYIGIKEGYLETYADRFVMVEGDHEILPGVMLLPHKTDGLDKLGEHAGMFVKIRGKFQPDSFQHEQSLVIETEQGLVVFNSCSHGGADNIIREVQKTWPDKKIQAYVGGLHLFRSGDEEVYSFAKRVKDTGIARIYTGHCTGDRAMEILKEELGEVIQELYTGLIMEF